MKSAFIAGTARNCGPGLIGSLTRLERLRSTFDRTKFAIVTNDNADNTKEILEDWASRVPDAHIICMDGLASKTTQRTARLAITRTAYLDLLRQDMAKGETFDLMIVADLDGLNAELIDDPGFTAALETAPSGWAAVFANSRGLYYDIWALRHPTWCPDDCYESVRNTPMPIFGRAKAKKAAVQRYVRDRQIVIDPSSAPIEVESAFGGFGIYRTEFLEQAAYCGLAANREVCEHVSFHEGIRKAGGRLYILPALLTATHPSNRKPRRLGHQRWGATIRRRFAGR